MRRFIQEARAASALNHPNILTILRSVREAPTPYIATEFIEGITLRRRLRDGRMGLMEAVETAIQIAERARSGPSGRHCASRRQA